MAQPQLENGHTQIANEILEQLSRTHLTSNQWQVLLCIIRKTYGFHKKVDWIANSQIVEATGLCKAVISRTLRSLNDMNIITRNEKRYIGFQKDWEKWQKLAESSTLDTKLAEQSTPEVSNPANQSLQSSQPKLAGSSTKVSSPATHKRKKDTIQKILYKRKHGEFDNVLLSEKEYQSLIERFGKQETISLIEDLSTGIESKGYKYKNHYATILSWKRRDQKQGGQVGTNRGHFAAARGEKQYTELPPFKP